MSKEVRKELIKVFIASCFLSLVAPLGRAQATYTLKPTPKTVMWGYYDAKAAPVLRIKSGDTVQIQTLLTSSPKRLEDAGVPPGLVPEAAHHARISLREAALKLGYVTAEEFDTIIRQEEITHP